MGVTVLLSQVFSQMSNGTHSLIYSLRQTQNNDNNTAGSSRTGGTTGTGWSPGTGGTFGQVGLLQPLAALQYCSCTAGRNSQFTQPRLRCHVTETLPVFAPSLHVRTSYMTYGKNSEHRLLL